MAGTGGALGLLRLGFNDGKVLLFWKSRVWVLIIARKDKYSRLFRGLWTATQKTI
jgi:hypothetical protein